VYSLFWDIRLNDEGAQTKESFFTLANAGKIELVAPMHVTGYAPNGRGVVLRDARTLDADAVVLATGYTSSWDGLLGTPLLASQRRGIATNICIM
jgi:dimethylaniline monooxygenase (N-oxide forming)